MEVIMSMSPLAPSATTGAGYDDLGHGDPALLLLPGWCGDRTLYDAVSTPLGVHRRVVVTDLRGQGGYADQRDDFDAATQVDDLVTLAGQLGLERVVPVTAAHAGWLAIELRRRLGADRVPGIVLVDWMVLGTPPGFMDALAGLQDEHAWQDVRAALFAMWTDGVGPQVVHDYVASMGRYGFAHWSRAGREIAASFTAEGSPLEALSKLEDPCAVLHLYAQPADDGHLAAQEAFAAEHPWFSVARMDACSHFPMLEVPGVVAGRIERFVTGL
jgi:pimeloyl-ACP methyl ester carboxylesterase